MLSVTEFLITNLDSSFFNQQIDDHGPFNDLEILKNKPGKRHQLILR